VAGVTVGSRNTCYRAARCGLTRTGLAPVGLHQLSLAPSEIQASELIRDPVKDYRLTPQNMSVNASTLNFVTPEVARGSDLGRRAA